MNNIQTPYYAWRAEQLDLEIAKKVDELNDLVEKRASFSYDYKPTKLHIEDLYTEE